MVSISVYLGFLKEQRVTVSFSLQRNELLGTCMVYACIQREKFCANLVQCMVNIPDETVQLQNIEANHPIECSSIRWVWTVGKAPTQEGILRLYLWNNNQVS